MPEVIKIRGAREHNLKDISVDIPKNRIVVITGPSGSGKSSLVFDTIYKEAYRRYMEAISHYRIWTLEQIERADIDIIEGLPPAICIRQWEGVKNPRSTVGTITEIYDYLRLLFSKIGRPYCPNCNKEISFYTVEEMVDKIISIGKGKKIQLLAPLKSSSDAIIQLRKDGFVRARIDERIVSLDEDINLTEKPKKIEAVVDRLIIKDEIRKRLSDSIELALSLSDGIVIVDILEEGELFLSKRPICNRCGFELPEITPQLFSFNNPKGACNLCNGLGEYKGNLCPECNGTRLKAISRHIKINDYSISDLSNMSLDKLYAFLSVIRLSKNESYISERIIKEIKKRLESIINMDIGYLSLNRSIISLSLGEEQRIRLATQVSSNLSGVLYIMDEPTCGLHPRDTERLIRSIKRLKENGNTVLVVEHDSDIIFNADHIIELGPGAGENGGRVVFQGDTRTLLYSDTITARYLSGKESIGYRKKRRRGSGKFLIIKGAKEHNLKSIDVSIPLGTLTCITGVSGSGKSTLVRDILYASLCNRLLNAHMKEGSYDEIIGVEHIKRVIYVDQRPIGKSPRSNPATYTGVFSYIRNLFSSLPEARARGYNASRFSLNVEGGRCEACKGEGLIKIEMDFLPDIYIVCEQCNGRRFNKNILEIRYKGMNIADVLDMTAQEAFLFFENIPPIRNRLKTFIDIGLGYIRLGQPANTISGGEAQRIKLIKELMKRHNKPTLFILDEPTCGLHPVDIKRLLDILNNLIDAGNSVVVVEHNLDVINSSDYIIDLGPGSAEEGGYIVATGTPEDISKNPSSWTGKFLKRYYR